MLVARALDFLGWNHISLTGDYSWRADKRIAQGRLKSLRRGIPPQRPGLSVSGFRFLR